MRAPPNSTQIWSRTIPDETTLHTAHWTLNQRVCKCATRPTPRTSKGHAFWRLQPRAHAWASASQAPDMHRTYRRASACTRRSACAAHGKGASAATAPLRHAVARPIGGDGLSDFVVVGTAGSAWLVGLRASTHGAFKWHVAWDRPWSGHGSAATRAQTGAHVPNKVFADALSVLDAPAEVLRRVGAPAHDPEALWASVCAGERASKGVCAGLDYLC
jgi:hypothetical protein